MKFYYMLDDHSRITWIDKNKLSQESLEIELDSIENIEVGWDGIVDGRVVYIGPTEQEKIESSKKDFNAEIMIYRSMLAETDWKVVVNAELLQNNLPIKYIGLHEQRQFWRDEINRLEQEMGL